VAVDRADAGWYDRAAAQDLTRPSPSAILARGLGGPSDRRGLGLEGWAPAGHTRSASKASRLRACNRRLPSTQRSTWNRRTGSCQSSAPLDGMPPVQCAGRGSEDGRQWRRAWQRRSRFGIQTHSDRPGCTRQLPICRQVTCLRAITRSDRCPRPAASSGGTRFAAVAMVAEWVRACCLYCELDEGTMGRLLARNRGKRGPLARDRRRL
jgi:hypothetical protein